MPRNLIMRHPKLIAGTRNDRWCFCEMKAAAELLPLFDPMD
jgi:hypothetical protein